MSATNDREAELLGVMSRMPMPASIGECHRDIALWRGCWAVANVQSEALAAERDEAQRQATATGHRLAMIEASLDARVCMGSPDEAILRVLYNERFDAAHAAIIALGEVP